jgi:hypothetical protein
VEQNASGEHKTDCCGVKIAKVFTLFFVCPCGGYVTFERRCIDFTCWVFMGHVIGLVGNGSAVNRSAAEDKMRISFCLEGQHEEGGDNSLFFTIFRKY